MARPNRNLTRRTTNATESARRHCPRDTGQPRGSHPPRGGDGTNRRRRKRRVETEGRGTQTVGGRKPAETPQVPVDRGPATHVEGRGQATAAVPVPVRGRRKG